MEIKMPANHGSPDGTERILAEILDASKRDRPKRKFWRVAGKVVLWTIGAGALLIIVVTRESPWQMVTYLFIGGFAGYFFDSWERDRDHTRRMLDQQAKETMATQRMLADIQRRMHQLDRDRGADA